MHSACINNTSFSWGQSLEEVYVDFVVERHMRKADVSIRFDYRCIKVHAGEVSIDHHTENSIIANECLWYFEDIPFSSMSRRLRLVLMKSQPGLAWTKVFTDQSEQLGENEQEETRKAILLERFSKENPDFDFSQTSFEGPCVPDARSFMGGLTL